MIVVLKLFLVVWDTENALDVGQFWGEYTEKTGFSYYSLYQN